MYEVAVHLLGIKAPRRHLFSVPRDAELFIERVLRCGMDELSEDRERRIWHPAHRIGRVEIRQLKTQ